MAYKFTKQCQILDEILIFDAIKTACRARLPGFRGAGAWIMV